MPPKSKKEVKNIQKKVIEDKTFGLKNKNKSKVLNTHNPEPSPLATSFMADDGWAPCLLQRHTLLPGAVAAYYRPCH
jgi:hypothetical protein